MTDRCAECYQPLTKNPDRRVLKDGQWMHPGCAETDELWTLLFPGRDQRAASRERVTADENGAALGHVIKLDRDQAGVFWRCSCGMRGPSVRSFDKSEARTHGRQHLRDMVVLGERA